MPILISILFASSILILAAKLLIKPQGVSLSDEYKKTRTSTHSVNKTVNLLIGCLGCNVFAWVVTGQLFWILLSIPGGFVVAKTLNSRKENARNKILRDQYTQVLSSLMISMQGGAAPYQALEETITTLSSPAKDVFIEIVRRARTGSNYEDAVHAVAEETGWKDLKSLEVALSLYSKTGCNLVIVFKHLLNSVYDNQSDRKYIEAVTASTRMTTIMLSGLPFLLMAFTRFSVPEFAAPLFNTTPGCIVVAAVIGMVLLGNKIVSKMLNNVVKSV